MLNDDQKKDYITALLEERAYCVRWNEDDRVKAIDVELRKVGHEAKAPAKRAESRPRTKKTETR